MIVGLPKYALSQIEDLSITDDVSLARLYCGISGDTYVIGRSETHGSLVSLHVGAMIYQELGTEKVLLRAFGALRFTNDETKSFTGYELIVRPLKGWEGRAGVLATPATLIRPNPTTWQSQVETNAQKTILGGRPGSRIQYKSEWGIGFRYGLFFQNEEFVHHAGIFYEQFSLAAYQENGQPFLAAKWSCENWEVVATYNQHGTLSTSIIAPVNDYLIYTDLSVSNMWEQIHYAVIGVRKPFENQALLLRGFISLNYDAVENRAWGGLFLHL